MIPTWEAERQAEFDRIQLEVLKLLYGIEASYEKDEDGEEYICYGGYSKQSLLPEVKKGLLLQRRDDNLRTIVEALVKQYAGGEYGYGCRKIVQTALLVTFNLWRVRRRTKKLEAQQ